MVQADNATYNSIRKNLTTVHFTKKPFRRLRLLAKRKRQGRRLGCKMEMMKAKGYLTNLLESMHLLFRNFRTCRQDCSLCLGERLLLKDSCGMILHFHTGRQACSSTAFGIRHIMHGISKTSPKQSFTGEEQEITTRKKV